MKSPLCLLIFDLTLGFISLASAPSEPFGGNQEEAPATSSSKLVAPSTTPTTLYLLEKNLTQSFSVPFSLSLKSLHSDETSSGFVEVFPRAREASFPAKTCQAKSVDIHVASSRSWKRMSLRGAADHTYRCMSFRADTSCCPSHHILFPAER